MHWTRKGILWSFHTLLFIVPLIFLPNTSELFEFNKMIVTYILTIFIAFFWLSRMATEGRIIFKRTILDIPITLFLLSNLLSLIFSIDVRTSMLGYYSRFNGGFLSLLSYAILYWSAVSNLEPKNVKSLLSATLSSAILVSCWAFLERLGIDASWWVQDVQNRVFSTLGQPNWLAAYLCALMFIPLGEYLKSKKISQFLLFSFFFLILLFTRSRSGLLAFGIGSIAFWIPNLLNITPLRPPLTLRGGSEGALQKFGFWILVIVAALLLVPNPIKDLFFRTSNLELRTSPGTALETGGTESGSIRKIVWSGALKIWQANSKNFWLGTGPETFATSYYQYRPIEHNATSEWELHYNKAHNEFLNYLATTGLLGLSTYLVLLISMLISNFKILNSNSILNSKLQNKLELRNSNLELNLALLCGWITIAVTNFWGFSVVIVQIFLFLFPAFAIILNSSKNQSENPTKNPFSTLIIIILILITGYLYIWIFRYWQADVYYAAGDNAYSAYVATSDPQYIFASYKHYSRAHQIAPKEPVITAQLGFTAAYMSLLTSESDSTTSAELAKFAQSLTDLSLTQNPVHPNLYKTASKTMIVLSVANPGYLKTADQFLLKAQSLSPTDPRIPYNRGIIAKQLGDLSQAKSFFNQAIILKPDFPDPKNALKDL